MSDICFLTACALAQLIQQRKLSALEVMQAHLAQIERVNPHVNAIVTLATEQATEFWRRRPEIMMTQTITITWTNTITITIT